ncbi:helix-turn-helix domain-containing protein [Actinokineospora sp. UTMC 2448]|uniref:helix-turn-helix domain-containing protein n=1 Tax=Actinokineospora sp. UTMC 2448 TaxID=2268449 RepID=UPI002164D346|nr:helix-turn-helix transcriptional regulator [Actinokineospora sp. UTMC 2448]UVS81995.1 Helix-turn-helix domain protein [Actinokineospora sp. UTMC 2448]
MAVGPLLRQWRQLRRISQLDLALAVDSSARHLSFVETGRARPSQAMLLKLAEHLEVPLRQRNALLVAAGYAPVYSALALDSPPLAPVRAGLERLLAAYEPYPALVFDGGYQVVAANAGVQRLLAGVDPSLCDNLMRALLHPSGLAPRVVHFPAWRLYMVERLERALPAWPALRALYDEVSGYEVVRGAVGGNGPLPDAGLVAQPFQLECDGTVLSFVTTATTFNTPLDVTVSELAVEAFLPADQHTASFLQG